MTPFEILQGTQRLRVSDGAVGPVLAAPAPARYWLVLLWPQLGDFDSLEYAWWLQRDRDRLTTLGIQVRAVGIGNRAAGQQFCAYTGFPEAELYVDATADLHHALDLYSGLDWSWPGLAPGQRAWLNLMLMCAGIASPGTLREVLRGYTGDRQAPQLFGDDEVIDDTPLPEMKGAFFRWAGGQGFQRPFELATLRLRNMTEVLGHWSTYVPDPAYLTQRGGTFLFDPTGQLVYQHRDRGILGFAENMSYPLSFLDPFETGTDAPAIVTPP